MYILYNKNYFNKHLKKNFKFKIFYNIKKISLLLIFLIYFYIFPIIPLFSNLSIGTPRYPKEKILLFKINEKNKKILSIYSEQNNYKKSFQ